MAETSSDDVDGADDGVRLKLARRATVVPTWLSLRLMDPPKPLPPSVRRRRTGRKSCWGSGGGSATAREGMGSPLVVRRLEAR